ncbi:MAG: hypothetical protein WC289_06370 [Patescibacteria group bacterium]|jgi:hypothetical protein
MSLSLQKALLEIVNPAIFRLQGVFNIICDNGNVQASHQTDTSGVRNMTDSDIAGMIAEIGQKLIEGATPYIKK